MSGIYKRSFDHNCCQLPDRKDLSIDDDIIYVYLTFKENTVKYYIKRFRLKKIEDMDTKVIMKIMIGKFLAILMKYEYFILIAYRTTFL